MVIAARAALRVLPFVLRGEADTLNAATVMLPVFRATAIARFAAVYPNRAIEHAAAFAATAASARRRRRRRLRLRRCFRTLCGRDPTRYVSASARRIA